MDKKILALVFELSGKQRSKTSDLLTLKRELNDSKPLFKVKGFDNLFFSPKRGCFYKIITNNLDLIKPFLIENINLVPHYRKEKGFTSLYLVLTNKCNLNCIYCSGFGGERNNRVADWKMIKTAIDFLAQFDELIDVDFSATGEQTLAFELLKKTVTYIKRKLNVFRLKISTNGVISKEKAYWLSDNFDLIQLSMDGPPFIQDLQRPLISGKGSSKFVEKTVQWFLEKKANFFVRSAASNLLFKHLEETLNYFVKIKVPTVQFVPLKPFGRALFNKIIPDPKETVLKLMQIYELGDIFYKELGLNVKVDLFAPFFQKLPRFCNLGYNFCMGIDGRIAGCLRYTDEEDSKYNPYMKHLIYGYYDKENNRIILDKEKLSKLRDFPRKVKLRSTDFKLYYGGCPYVNLVEYNDIFIPSSYTNSLSELGFNERIRYLAMQNIKRFRPFLIRKNNEIYLKTIYSLYKVSIFPSLDEKLILIYPKNLFELRKSLFYIKKSDNSKLVIIKTKSIKFKKNYINEIKKYSIPFLVI